MKWKCSPLPFEGQKRGYGKILHEILKRFPDSSVFVDLFGGSGLLSRMIKDEKPDSKVVFNDYDEFANRLNNIPKTNALIADIREITAGCEYKKRIDKVTRLRILQRILRESGYVDYLTLSVNLLFSGKYRSDYDTFSRETMFHRVVQKDYSCEGYLDGLDIVRCDYKLLFKQYLNAPNVVFVVDPPYLATDNRGYKENYWRIKDYLNVIEVLSGTSYIFFTSEKSCLPELCEWMYHHKSLGDVFRGAERIEMIRNINFNSSYKDIMFVKE